MDYTRNVPVQRIIDGRRKDDTEVVAREFPLTIMLNSRELNTMLCSPDELENLTVGFLVSEGVLKTRQDIKSVTADERKRTVNVETAEGLKLPLKRQGGRLIASGGGRGVSLYNAEDIKRQPKIESELSISSATILALAAEFQRRSEVFQNTGGVHSAALCQGGQILLFKEDIGRHNAVDKILGQCMMEDISTRDRIIMTSGRVSSEILLKVSRRGIPILISRSAPTDMGVELAEALGMTLVGFARGERMNLYANAWRVTTTEDD